LRHTITSAQEIGIDPSRVVIAGGSSGGGCAASLALRVRDDGEFTVAHQLLVYPMLDDTGTTPSSHQVTDPELWNRDLNELAWSAYLGDAYGTDDVSPYAAPTRVHDLTGSVPASILTAELDLFRDEDITYALRLMAAEVPTELHVYPGAPHGFFSYAPEAGASRRFFNDRNAILKRVFG
jgi:acetyl esterase/lipase